MFSICLWRGKMLEWSPAGDQRRPERQQEREDRLSHEATRLETYAVWRQ
jgi:hypothetical protein